MAAKLITIALFFCSAVGAQSDLAHAPNHPHYKQEVKGQRAAPQSIDELTSTVLGMLDDKTISASAPISSVNSVAALAGQFVADKAGFKTSAGGSSGATVMPYIVWFALLAMFAYWYKNMDGKEHFLLPEAKAGQPLVSKSEWVSGLFDCFQYPNLTLLSCCCGPVRWADTISMAKINAFWISILAVFLLYTAGLLIGIGAVLTALFYTFNRQKLRQVFGMSHGDCQSITKDFFTYLCCPCCAIVQEAVQVETYAKGGELPDDLEQGEKKKRSTTTCCMPIQRPAQESA